jgi:hypothetical protein
MARNRHIDAILAASLREYVKMQPKELNTVTFYAGRREPILATLRNKALDLQSSYPSHVAAIAAPG